MENFHRRASRPVASPQKFRPGGPPKRKTGGGVMSDSLLLAPDVLDDATRRELMQEMLRPRRASRSTLKPLPSPHGTGDVGAHHDKEPYASQLRSRVRTGSQCGDDLVTVMASRLKEVEVKQKAYQAELQELHGKYRQLNDRYQREKKLREEAETAVLTLYDEKEALEQQLATLEEGDEEGEERERSPSRQGAMPRLRLTAAAVAAETGEKIDLFSGDYNEGDGEKIAPTHFVNTARPGTLLFSPQKTHVDGAGEKKQKDGAAVRAQAVAALKGRHHSLATVDVALLQKNARTLSDYVGWKGVVRHGQQAGIRERDVVHVVVYRNGICVNRGPFRPYGWALCDAFLDDLTEGYYPYEFKDRYPDGFPIEITDHSEETCEVDGNGKAGVKKASSSAPAAPHIFPADGGQRLGGAPLPVNGDRPIHTLQDVKDDVGYNPVSAADFLRNVPAQRVTASGQLVSVRDSVAALMSVRAQSAATPSSPSLPQGPSNMVKRMAAAEAACRRAAEERRRACMSPPVDAKRISKDAAAAPTAKTLSGSSSMVLGNLITVLVRLPSGPKVTLHVAPESTVLALRKEFVAAAPQYAQLSYEFVQAYPVKCEWKVLHKTLASMGVRQSCTLMVRAR